MSFLPPNYEAPVSEGNYYKLKKGANAFRVIGSAVVGYEYWTKDNKPVRAKQLWDEIPSDARLDKVPNTEREEFRPKFFWAFPVWNYEAKKVQVMQITQKTIREAMEALLANPKWGDPKGYDITVTAVGDGFEREYTVIPDPHTPTPNAVANINLEALFTGEDPFANPATHQKDVELEPVSEMDYSPKPEDVKF